MVEAGTGVGKSLAYLILRSSGPPVNDTPVVISTATRNLQSQLMSSDIPKALEVLGDGARAFKVALLKGRANYLCLRAVGDFFSSGYWRMSKDEQDGMPGFIRWLETTEDGDLDRYDGQLPRELLSCPGEECGGRRCPFHSRCFVYRRAQRRRRRRTWSSPTTRSSWPRRRARAGNPAGVRTPRPRRGAPTSNRSRPSI